MIRWLRAEVLTRMLIDSKDMHNIFHVSSKACGRILNFIFTCNLK
jgi:hypothetical protein